MDRDYKTIPIIIMNRDRLEPMQMLIRRLMQKGYKNITILDNGSTYQPLLKWYSESKDINIFFNNEVEQDLYALCNLMFSVKNERFLELTSDYYVFTDSDVIPIDEIPDDFIETMVAYCKRHQVDKVGLGIKIDDIEALNPNPKHTLIQKGIENESHYWENPIEEVDCLIYRCPVDTTFAVYAPNTTPAWSDNSIRMGYPYLIKHVPFYYDLDNLPEEEEYYLNHMNHHAVAWSTKLKQYKNNHL